MKSHRNISNPLRLGACLFLGLGVPVGALAEAIPASVAADVPFPIIERFENLRLDDGLPSHKIHGVLKAADGRLWVGTWDGLLVREDGKFRKYGPAEGLTHKMVLSMSEDPKTGDMWVGTMRGLNRVSAGRVKPYLQTDSGLPNNVVYGVDVVGEQVWAATAAGTGALNLKTGEWKIYDHRNAAMHEPWCYSIKGSAGKVFIGVWGGGIVEHDPVAGTFKEYRDPDADFHYDLVPDDGPINDITSWLAIEDGVLWQTTYFGCSRYDGRSWKTWTEGKSPLPSNFTQFVWSHRKVGWIGSDRGLSVTDGKVWVNYLVAEKGEGVVEVHRPGRSMERYTTTTALANAFVLGIYVDDTEAWMATSDGLSRGVFRQPVMAAAPTR